MRVLSLLALTLIIMQVSYAKGDDVVIPVRNFLASNYPGYHHFRLETRMVSSALLLEVLGPLWNSEFKYFGVSFIDRSIKYKCLAVVGKAEEDGTHFVELRNCDVQFTKDSFKSLGHGLY